MVRGEGEQPHFYFCNFVDRIKRMGVIVSEQRAHQVVAEEMEQADHGRIVDRSKHRQAVDPCRTNLFQKRLKEVLTDQSVSLRFSKQNLIT